MDYNAIDSIDITDRYEIEMTDGYELLQDWHAFDHATNRSTKEIQKGMIEVIQQRDDYRRHVILNNKDYEINRQANEI